jgi:hypothetical protein
MITEDSDGDRSYWVRADTYPRLKHLFAGYARAKQSEAQRRDRQTLWAACAWYVGKYEDARAAFDALGDNAVPAVFISWGFGTTLEEARGETYALSGAQGAQARQAERLAASGDFARASASYRTLLTTADAHAVPYYRQRLAEVEMDDRWARGEWVELRPDPGFDWWIHEQGNWKVAPDGTITGASTERGLWLLCDRDFGHRLEFEGEVDLASFEDKRRANFGVLVDATGTGGGDFIAFQASRYTGTARVTSDLDDRGGDSISADVKDRNSFRVVLWDGKVDAYLNGRALYRDTQMEKTSGPAPERVGVGAGHGGRGAVVRFRNLRVRLLKSDPG